MPDRVCLVLPIGANCQAAESSTRAYLHDGAGETSSRRDRRKYSIVCSENETSTHFPRAYARGRHATNKYKRARCVSTRPRRLASRGCLKGTKEPRGVVRGGTEDGPEYLCRLAVAAQRRPLIYLTKFGLSRVWMRGP